MRVYEGIWYTRYKKVRVYGIRVQQDVRFARTATYIVCAYNKFHTVVITGYMVCAYSKLYGIRVIRRYMVCAYKMGIMGGYARLINTVQ